MKISDIPDILDVEKTNSHIRLTFIIFAWFWIIVAGFALIFSVFYAIFVLVDMFHNAYPHLSTAIGILMFIFGMCAWIATMMLADENEDERNY